MPEKILIIEDDTRMRRILQLVIESRGYRVATAVDGEDGIAKWENFQPDVILSDLKMPNATGMDVLTYGNNHYPHIPVILLTAFGTIPAAVEAMKQDAYDYITKPVDNDMIIEKIKAALLKKSSDIDTPAAHPARLIGSSTRMNSLRKELKLVAGTNTSIFITGASGSGKEMAAKTIHDLSPQRDKAFIRINCAAIPKELMESELFGHIKGAFTGAVQNRQGAFLQADNGTLFLDEIGDMSYGLQAKLLHAVEAKEITPVGSTRSIKVDVKIISATNQDIAKMVEQKTFRPDLYFRLNAYPIHIPPLKDRLEDLPELANHFLILFCHSFQKPVPLLQKKAMTVLSGYSWPGNVRELKNTMERLVLISDGSEITPDLVTRVMQKNKASDKMLFEPPKKDLLAYERRMIKDTLIDCEGNISKTARQLGITRNTLRYRLKKFHITPS